MRWLRPWMDEADRFGPAAARCRRSRNERKPPHDRNSTAAQVVQIRRRPLRSSRQQRQGAAECGMARGSRSSRVVCTTGRDPDAGAQVLVRPAVPASGPQPASTTGFRRGKAPALLSRICAAPDRHHAGQGPARNRKRSLHRAARQQDVPAPRDTAGALVQVVHLQVEADVPDRRAGHVPGAAACEPRSEFGAGAVIVTEQGAPPRTGGVDVAVESGLRG